MSDNDEALSDYVDGRPTPAQKEAFERRLSRDPALARRLRLLRAMKSSLSAAAPGMPADLKAALKREARARRSWREDWRAALGGASWAGFGLGAAFATAGAVLALRLAAPGGLAQRPTSPASSGLPAAAGWKDSAASQGLKDLWSDDDGRDGDEG
jgi:anti-sigma factor RsiW